MGIPNRKYFSVKRRRGESPVSQTPLENPENPLNPDGSGGGAEGQIPPVSQRYNSESEMISDQENQRSGYLYFDGTSTWWYMGGANGDISDYFLFALDEADVLSTVLTGYSVGTNTPLSSTDTVLGAYQKIQGQLNNLSSTSHSPVTIGTANGLSLSGQELSLGLASSGVTGTLSGADWDTFNGKIGGAGTVNRLAKFTAIGTVGDSRLIDNGTSAYFSNQQNSFAFGNGAGQVADYNNNIFALGYNAGYSNNTGSSWYASGYLAGYSNTTGTNWYASGYLAGYSNTIGSGWYASGYNAGRLNTTGSNWHASGYFAGYSNTTGTNWYASGALAGYSNTTGLRWHASGYNAGRLNTTGSNWHASGYNAGRYYSSGGDAESFSNGLYIGYDTRVGHAGAENEIVIGYLAKGEGSNKTVIGNSSTILTRLYGELRINTINNLGTSATEVLVPDATGVVMKRTVGELVSDMGAISTIDTNAVHYNDDDGKTASEKDQARQNIGSVDSFSGRSNQVVIISSDESKMDTEGAEVLDLSGIVGKKVFTALEDTFPSMSGRANEVIVVNNSENELDSEPTTELGITEVVGSATNNAMLEITYLGETYRINVEKV